MKIKRKLCLIGNKFKTLCDARSKAVLYVDLYEAKELMQRKRYANEAGETSVYCLQWKKAI